MPDFSKRECIGCGNSFPQDELTDDGLCADCDEFYSEEEEEEDDDSDS